MKLDIRKLTSVQLKKLRTRSGREVTIYTTTAAALQPVVGHAKGLQGPCSWFVDGQFYHGVTHSDMDLVLPIEKLSGSVVLYLEQEPGTGVGWDRHTASDDSVNHMAVKYRAKAAIRLDYSEVVAGEGLSGEVPEYKLVRKEVSK